jgi:hypothetical protein
LMHSPAYEKLLTLIYGININLQTNLYEQIVILFYKNEN